MGIINMILDGLWFLIGVLAVTALVVPWWGMLLVGFVLPFILPYLLIAIGVLLLLRWLFRLFAVTTNQ